MWTEIVKVDDIINSISIHTEDYGNLNYSQLCSKRNDECYENSILELAPLMGQIETGKLRLGYPLMFNPITYQVHSLPHFFGGLELKEENRTLQKAEALFLFYFIAPTTNPTDGLPNDW